MAENFTVEQNAQIVIDSFISTNIAELCRRHSVSVAQFHSWKERFLEGGRKGLRESSRGNEYQKGIDDLKRLVDAQILVISEKKNSTQNDLMVVFDALKEIIPVARISRPVGVSRSFIYYRRSERSEKRRERIPEDIESEVKRISFERTTYGYRRIWALSTYWNFLGSTIFDVFTYRQMKFTAKLNRMGL